MGLIFDLAGVNATSAGPLVGLMTLFWIIVF
jgi:hypothetical protein